MVKHIYKLKDYESVIPMSVKIKLEGNVPLMLKIVNVLEELASDHNYGLTRIE